MRKQPAKRNPMAQAVRTPRFRVRVVRDRKKYSRKEKHKGRGDAAHSYDMLVI
jgi:hypothetical protein